MDVESLNFLFKRYEEIYVKLQKQQAGSKDKKEVNEY